MSAEDTVAALVDGAVGAMLVHGIPESVARMAANRAAGNAREAARGLTDPLHSEVLVAKARVELAGAEAYARRYIDRVSA